MAKSLVSKRVRIKESGGMLQGKKGHIIAVGKEGRRKEYIVQFKKPNVVWCYFVREDFVVMRETNENN